MVEKISHDAEGEVENGTQVTEEMKEEAERIKNEANVAFRGMRGVFMDLCD